jgi:L-ascorbate metabolism protein UlaG (beta-lactamase superfamily)
MVIKWLGHSCFLITSKKGVRIVTDPYAVGGGIDYSPIRETADVVLVSHSHADHNNVSAVQGNPEVVKGSGARTAKGIQLRGVDTYHDGSKGKLRGANIVFCLGKLRGANIVFCFTVDDINLCHLGDLGHVLSQVQMDEIGSVDVLFIPVGGSFTIDATEAGQVCDQLNPKVIIPMHFKTPKCAYPVASVADFLEGKKNVRKLGSSEAEFELENLPGGGEIAVLEPAL